MVSRCVRTFLSSERFYSDIPFGKQESFGEEGTVVGISVFSYSIVIFVVAAADELSVAISS